MRNEPVITAAAISGILISLASAFNIGIEADTVETIVAAVLPLVLSLFARSKVTPVG